MRKFISARYLRAVTIGFASLLSSVAAMSTYAESRVFKCTDVNGQVSFNQTGCVQGRRESLKIESQNIGWIDLETAVEKFKVKKERSAKETPKRKKSVLTSVERKHKKSCWQARKKVERITDELRHGYKLSHGERLRKQRAEQEEYLTLFCQDPPD